LPTSRHAEICLRFFFPFLPYRPVRSVVPSLFSAPKRLPTASRSSLGPSVVCDSHDALPDFEEATNVRGLSI
jgi:hypothetical protein